MARETGAEVDRNWYSMVGAETRPKEAVMKYNRLSGSTNAQKRTTLRPFTSIDSDTTETCLTGAPGVALDHVAHVQSCENSDP